MPAPMAHRRAFVPAPCGVSSRHRLISVAGKGFGDGAGAKSKKPNEADIPVPGMNNDKKRRAVKSKGKQQMRQPGQRYSPPRQPGVPNSPDLMTPDDSLTEQLEFEARLKALAAVAKEKKASLPAGTTSSQANVLDRPNYENPPPLTSTLFGTSNDAESTSSATAEDASDGFGPSQVGLAVASLALVGIFVITSGGSDLGYASRRPSSTSGARLELGEEQRQELKAQLADTEKRLEANSDDVEALEAAAVLHARLGEYDQAIPQLERLTAAKPSDVDAFRVLAETRAAAGDSTKAVEAYQKAWEASGKQSLEVLTGLTGALVADGRPAAAVDAVKAAAGTAGSSSALGEVELGMLEAKVLAAWKGHGPDAALKYDALIEAFPQDFRPPLGKALLLRQQGREGDAQRYFIQAKYLAPPPSRAAVEAFASATEAR